MPESIVKMIENEKISKHNDYINYEAPESLTKLKQQNFANSVFLTHEIKKSAREDIAAVGLKADLRLSGNMFKGNKFLGEINGML
jgi:hypothetical protein